MVENTKKIKIKHLWLRVWGPSEFHRPLLGSPGPGPMYRLNPPPLVWPDSKDESVFARFNLSFHFQYYSLHTNTNQNVKKMSS